MDARQKKRTLVAGTKLDETLAYCREWYGELSETGRLAVHLMLNSNDDSPLSKDASKLCRRLACIGWMVIAQNFDEMEMENDANSQE